VISPTALGGVGADPATVRDRFSAAYLVAVAARVVQEVGELGARAEKAGRRLATLTLETEVRFASAEARAAFAEELARSVARLTDIPTRRPGRWTFSSWSPGTRQPIPQGDEMPKTG
jgi:hypothetical protein